MKLLPLRLRPGQDLKESLLRLCEQEAIEAACVLSCVGSLRHIVLRMADQSAGSVFTEKMEILTLSGTLSRHGAHLHISLSDNEGKVIGGHLMPGSLIYTTAEIVLCLLPDVQFQRTHDPDTGYLELAIIPQATKSTDLA